MLLYRTPAEGIPEEGTAGGAILASRVSICGTEDAGTLRNEESKIIAVMSSNVDDLLYGSLPEGAEAMNSVLQHFLVGKEAHNSFRFCGKEFEQDEDFGIRVTAKDSNERVQPITYEAKHGLTRKAIASEVRQLRSVTQSLAGIARQTRPDFSYRIFEDPKHFRKCLCSRLA